MAPVGGMSIVSSFTCIVPEHLEHLVSDKKAMTHQQVYVQIS